MMISDNIRDKDSGYRNVAIEIEGLYEWGTCFGTLERKIAF